MKEQSESDWLEGWNEPEAKVQPTYISVSKHYLLTKPMLSPPAHLSKAVCFASKL